MKITFKDGTVIDKLVSVSVTNVKRNGKYTPIINVLFGNSVGFSDLESVMTDENISSITVETEKDGKDNVIRTYEGFNKIYMAENISDDNYQFIVSFEKHETETAEFEEGEDLGTGEGTATEEENNEEVTA